MKSGCGTCATTREVTSVAKRSALYRFDFWSMKLSKLLIAAVLVIAIGSPIAGFVGHIKLPLSTTPTGEPVAFFHGLGTGPAANQSGLPSLERADAWLNSPPLTTSALRGKIVLWT